MHRIILSKPCGFMVNEVHIFLAKYNKHVFYRYDGLIPGEGHGSNDLGGDDAAAAPVSIGGDDAASAAPGYNYENA